jgi:hypothetical protein
MLPSPRHDSVCNISDKTHPDPTRQTTAPDAYLHTSQPIKHSTIHITAELK